MEKKIKHLWGILPIEMGKVVTEKLNFAGRHEGRERPCRQLGKEYSRQREEQVWRPSEGSMLDASEGERGRQCGERSRNEVEDKVRGIMG